MIDVNYNEYKETIADNMKLIQENHKLKERIDKAIEYIEKHTTKFNDIFIPASESWYLLEILGSAKK